ncbi:MAG: hypothetical protein WA655_17565 [Candidatus Korobacteraceae bacterium]
MDVRFAFGETATLRVVAERVERRLRSDKRSSTSFSSCFLCSAGTPKAFAVSSGVANGPMIFTGVLTVL